MELLTVNVTRQNIPSMKCNICRGNGKVNVEFNFEESAIIRTPCSRCGGTGRITYPVLMSAENEARIRPCSCPNETPRELHYFGSGVNENYPDAHYVCGTCNGIMKKV
jgi:hypothetical protein